MAKLAFNKNTLPLTAYWEITSENKEEGCKVHCVERLLVWE